MDDGFPNGLRRGGPPRGGRARAAATVSQITEDIRQALEQRFFNCNVRGEVTNVRRSSGGHLYFTLRDPRAQLPCVIFQRDAVRMPLRLADGLEVIAFGDINVYPPHGRYQLVVRAVAEAGLGDLLTRMEQTKRRLAAEGLFDPARKRPLPPMPRGVGVVTAESGAALRDILATIRARFPTRVLVFPCKVQGDAAVPGIVRGIAALGRHPDVDVLIVGRGGGSLEDLWAFNEEAVVRAIAACPKPVVSAVGHEIDNVLSDLVADARAATPTAAGELVVPRRDALAEQLSGRVARLARATRRHLADARLGLADQQGALDRAVAGRLAHGRHRRAELAGRLRNLHPRARLATGRERLGALRARLRRAGAEIATRRRRQLAELVRTLAVLSPTASLERGYAIVRRADDGRVVRAAQALAAGDKVELVVHRGRALATVDATRPEPATETDTP